VSLFPFLSVLVCVIGALSMIIIGTVLGTSGQAFSADVPEDTVERTGLEQKKALLEEKIALEEKALQALLKDLRDVGGLRQSVGVLEANVADANNAKTGLEAELAALTRKVTEEAKKLEDKKRAEDPNLAAVVIVVPPQFQGESNYKPVVVDCRKDGILFLQSGRKVKTDEIGHSMYVNEVVTNARRAGTWAVLMLIRGDGVEAFQKLRTEVVLGNVPHGYVPVLSDKDFDVSNWEKPGWLKD
jgi:hypothetical protein